jgi:two-component system phosphate regulon sensor histidine kinase PhoR
MTRIQTKITLTYLVLMLLVVLVVGVFASVNMEKTYRERLVSDLADRTDLIATLLRAHPTLEPEVMDVRLKEVARTANLRITLIDGEGRVITDSDVPFPDLGRVENHLHRPEVQRALSRGTGTDQRHSATVGKDFMYFAKRLDSTETEGALSGVKFVRLSEHLEDVETAVREIRLAVVFAGCGVLVLVVLASVLVSKRVARPMVSIAEQVDEIRGGNLDVRLDVHADDEIGRVARAINEMVDRLKIDIAQLKKLERVRSEFLGNVSHELRTPIFSLQGFLETLMNGAVDYPSVNRAFLQKAYSHAERLNTLLGDLITISQIESGEMMLSFRYFRANEFLASLVNDFLPVAQRNKVALRLATRLSPDVDVYGDKERLAVALGNLIENAIKYNKENGEVVVSLRQTDGRVEVSVADTGVGIGREHIQRIFERFYRVDKNRSRDVGGTGLGLAIVKHIVEAHGSTVEVESDVGKGSTFSFTLKK